MNTRPFKQRCLVYEHKDPYFQRKLYDEILAFRRTHYDRTNDQEGEKQNSPPKTTSVYVKTFEEM
jgi:hypothetical protein